jgi:hypothetical protein
MITPPSRHRPHPAALPPTPPTPPTRAHGPARTRPRPQTIEEAKLNLRVAAARRHEQRQQHAGFTGMGGVGGHETLVGDLASSAIRFAKDHPAALATGIGVIALVVGPGALLKGVTTAARLATVAGLIGKATR